MYSRNANAIVELYSGFATCMQKNPDMSMAELRLTMDHWGDITDEPRGVDYLETSVSGVPALMAIPENRDSNRVILCAHGGGYCVGSMYSHRKLFGHIAKALSCQALIVDYRRAPEHPVPAQIDDMVSAYEQLLEEGYPPEKLIIAGDSAGGCIAVSTLLAAREAGLPMPAGAICMSPWFDPEVTGESAVRNARADCFVTKELLQGMALAATGGEGSLRDPRINVLQANLANLPPIYIQVGGSEVLLDDSLRFRAMGQALGNDVCVDVFPGMQHVFHFMAGRAPEANDAITKMAVWANARQRY